jgi:hypothetical protein
VQQERRERLLLAGAVALSIVFHGSFVIRGFGEPDAARLAVAAGEWHATGTSLYQSYIYRTSPLYIHALKKLLDLGLPYTALPAFLNWASVVIGSLTLIPLYLLWRTLADRGVAALACVLLSFTPAFWVANIYGMAHLPSFSLFVTGLLFFTRGLDRSGGAFAFHMVISAVLGILAVCLKADMILSCGAFLGVCLLRRKANVRTVALALAIPALAIFEVTLYARWIAADLGGLGAFAGAWSERFPFTIDALRDGYNRTILANSMGYVVYVLCVLAIAYCVMMREHTRELVLVALWALPTVMFWGLKLGNSARHMMAAVAVLVFLAALVVRTRIRAVWLLGSVTVCVLTLNYVLGPPKGNTISPTSQLHILRRVVQDYVGNLHEGATSFALLPMPAKMFVGGPGAPYAVFDVMARAKAIEAHPSDAPDEKGESGLVEQWPRYVATFPDDKIYIIGVRQVASPYRMPPMDDWFAYSNESAISTMNDMRIWQPYLNDAVREHPDRAFEWATTVSLRLITGVAFMETGQHGKALQMFTDALAVAPNDPDVLWSTAMLLGELGRIAEYRQRLTQFVRLHPNDERAAVAREELAKTEPTKP